MPRLTGYGDFSKVTYGKKAFRKVIEPLGALEHGILEFVFGRAGDGYRIVILRLLLSSRIVPCLRLVLSRSSNLAKAF